MKYIPAIFFFLECLYGTVSVAQTAQKKEDSVRRAMDASWMVYREQVDSLIKLIKSSPMDTLKAKRLNALSELLVNFSYDSAVSYATEAKTLSESLDYPQGLYKAIRNLGAITEAHQNDWITAIDYYKQAIAVAEQNDLYEDMHLGYTIIMNCYFYVGDFPASMDIATRGLNSATEKKDNTKILKYNNLIGAIYLRQENFSEALKYYRASMQMADRLNDDTERNFVYLGLADVLIAKKDSLQAFSYLFRSLVISRKLFDKPSHTLRHKIAYTLYRIGYAYKIFGNLFEGLKYTLDALEFTKKVSCDKFDIANYYLQAGDIYRQLNDYQKAKQNLYKGLAIAKEIRHKENTRDAFGYLAKTFSDAKEFDSAYIYSQLHIQLKDSIVNEISRYRTEEIKAIYDIKEKDSEIARQENIRNIMIALFAFLLVTLGFLYNRYQLRQKNRYQRELNRQQNELFNAIAVAQDQERKRIAQDIHDSLGAVLSAAKLRLSALKESQPLLSDEQVEKYNTTLQLLDEAAAELRNISQNIMPATLSKLGLVAAINNLSTTISSHSGLQINFTAHDFDERINEQTEMSMYRIILELINNVVKHAQATKVTIQLIKYPDYINLSVEDNGWGFDYQQALQKKKGIGLGNIISRVEYLKGTINVDAKPGRGTTAIIDIPYK